jgi:hypothetical protein
VRRLPRTTKRSCTPKSQPAQYRRLQQLPVPRPARGRQGWLHRTGQDRLSLSWLNLPREPQHSCKCSTIIVPRISSGGARSRFATYHIAVGFSPTFRVFPAAPEAFLRTLSATTCETFSAAPLSFDPPSDDARNDFRFSGTCRLCVGQWAARIGRFDSSIVDGRGVHRMMMTR